MQFRMASNCTERHPAKLILSGHEILPFQKFVTAAFSQQSVLVFALDNINELVKVTPKVF